MRADGVPAIRREAAWVTGCEDVFVEQVLAELQAFVSAPRGLSYASHWLVSVVDRVFDDAMRDASEEDAADMHARAQGDAKPGADTHQEDSAAAGHAPNLEQAGAQSDAARANSDGQEQGNAPTRDAAEPSQSQSQSQSQSELQPQGGPDHVSAVSAGSSAGEFAERQAVRRIQAFHKAARHVLQSWSYYSVQVLRELTVRNAPSFGSFNVARVLFDEYMFYLVSLELLLLLLLLLMGMWQVQTRVTHPHKTIRHPDVIVRTDGATPSSLSVCVLACIMMTSC